jgi:hypothetical protein
MTLFDFGHFGFEVALPGRLPLFAPLPVFGSFYSGGAGR